MQRLRVGDRVRVISGSHKGKEGRIAKISKYRDLVTIEGVNVVTRHMKPTQQNPEGGSVEKEAPLQACKVMPIDPETGKPTRVKIRVEGDKKVRVAKSGAIITAEGDE